jgi:ketosteroid isomerase-like protein
MTSDIQNLLDRAGIEQTLYRYAVCVDRRDLAGVRSVFTEDAVFVGVTISPSGDPVEQFRINGADGIVELVRGYLAERSWTHHYFNVVQADVAGDQAHAITYHTSHEILRERPQDVSVAVAVYDDTLVRRDGRWAVKEKIFQVGWSGTHAGAEADVSVWLAQASASRPR